MRVGRFAPANPAELDFAVTAFHLVASKLFLNTYLALRTSSKGSFLEVYPQLLLEYLITC
jgi:hypothetical protein